MLIQTTTAAFLLAVLTGSRACIVGALALLVLALMF
jgi:hypothetical protein